MSRQHMQTGESLLTGDKYVRLTFPVKPIKKAPQSTNAGLYGYGSKLTPVLHYVRVVTPPSSVLKIEYELSDLGFIKTTETS